MDHPRTADHATGSAGIPERSRTPSATTSGVLALQRLAGNRAACAAIAAAPRRMLQRELKFKPRALEVAKASTGSAKGVAEFDAITKLLVSYYATRRVEERFALVQTLQVDVGKWLKTHPETSDLRKLAKRGPDPRRVELGKLLAELDAEVENARSEHMYVRQLRDTAKTREQKVYATPHFEFASTDLAAAIDETDVLMSEDNSGRSIDDSVSSKLAANRGLTDAELLALKVYTTGDYNTINPALDQDAGAGARFKSNLVKIPGTVRTAGGPQSRPVAPAFDWNAAPQHRAAAQAAYDTAKMKYDAEMVKFNALAAPLLADTTKLAEAKADALRHASLVERAISKLEPFGQMAYRGERWDAATFKTMYQDKLKAVMTPATRFLSASTSEAKAETFAKGTDPSDKQEGVLVKLKCNGVKARDIHLLSHLRHELEVLLLPGAKIYIDAITETDPKKRAQLGYRYIVQAHEVP